MGYCVAAVSLFLFFFSRLVGILKNNKVHACRLGPQALARWKPWIPPKLEQGLQQGGTFVFEGDQVSRPFDA